MIERTAAGVRLRVLVQPRAARSEIVGPHRDQVRVRVTAPPVEGAANEALVRLLAERLGLPRSAVSVVAGGAGRSKVVAVTGISREEALKRLGLPPAGATD